MRVLAILATVGLLFVPLPALGQVVILQHVLYTASDGFTPEAESLAPLMNATSTEFFIHGGDATFTDAHPTECPTWPTLQWYCSPSILTDQQIEASWQAMRWPLLQQDRAISYGNHEMGGKVKPDPFVAAQFGNQPFWTYRLFDLPGGLRVLLVFLDSNQTIADGSVQNTWLRQVLQANVTVDWKLVFAHGMPYSATKPDLSLRVLTPLFDIYQVDLIVSGHVLWYERTHQYIGQTPGYSSCGDGICVTDSNSAGAFLKGVGRINVNAGCGGMRCFGTATNPMPTNKTWPVYHAKHIGIRHHYATIEWNADGGTLTFRAKDAAGTLDMFTILR